MLCSGDGMFKNVSSFFQKSRKKGDLATKAFIGPVDSFLAGDNWFTWIIMGSKAGYPFEPGLSR